jgi:Putative zinc-finger
MKHLLPEYAAGTLPPGQREAVRGHLVGCADCRAELSSWLAMTAGPVEPPGPAIVRRALLQEILVPVGGCVVDGPRWRLPAALLRAQARLVPTGVWPAAAAVMALGVAVAYRSSIGWAGSILAMVAPIMAALCIAGVCGPSRDPAFEVCAATRTGPRPVLLARVTLVFGYDLALALTGSGLLWLLGVRARGLDGLVSAWLGPTALLSSVALLACVLVSAEAAAAAATCLWVLRVACGGWFGADLRWLSPVQTVWTTTPATMLAAVVLVAIAATLAGRTEPRPPQHATYSA